MTYLLLFIGSALSIFLAVAVNGPAGFVLIVAIAFYRALFPRVVVERKE